MAAITSSPNQIRVATNSGNNGNTTFTAVNTANNATTKTVDATKTGFNGLTANDFLKLLIAQLQQQDPENPTDSSQLLDQVSQLRSISANDSLNTTLTALNANSQLSQAAGYLGKTVTASGGTDSTGRGLPDVTGVVSKVVISNGVPQLTVGSQTIGVSAIKSVSN